MRRRDLLLGTLGLLAAAACGREDDAPSIFLIGDSTVSDYPASARPLMGWGQAMKSQLEDRGPRVLNHAVPGASTRRFKERHWPETRRQLRNGDLLLMQFGHNDASPDPERHAEPQGLFSTILEAFTEEARARGAHPALVTPIPRYRFAGDLVVPTLEAYAEAMRALATRKHVPCLDLHRLLAEAMQSAGPVKAREWFMISQDGNDTVHLTRKGADTAAAIVTTELSRLGLMVNN